MKRGQGTTMSLEEFIKLAMSIFLAGILLTIIASVYLWWASPDLKSDASAINSLENLAGLINAQEGEEWETRTFIHIPQNFALVGFGQDSAYGAVGGTKAVEIENRCENCLCIFSIDNQEYSLVKCEKASEIEEFSIASPVQSRNIYSTTLDDVFVNCFEYVIKKQEGISIRPSLYCEEQKPASGASLELFPD